MHINIGNAQIIKITKKEKKTIITIFHFSKSQLNVSTRYFKIFQGFKVVFGRDPPEPC